MEIFPRLKPSRTWKRSETLYFLSDPLLARELHTIHEYCLSMSDNTISVSTGLSDALYTKPP